MDANEFAQKHKFSNVDKNIVNTLYGKEDKTEEEWFDLLEKDIDFDKQPFLNKAAKKKQVKEIKEGNK